MKLFGGTAQRTPSGRSEPAGGMASAPRTTPLALAVSALLLAAAAAVPAAAAAADAPCLSELCVDAGGADGCFGDLQEALDAACVDGARVVVRAGFHDVNYVVAEGLSNLVLEGEAGAGEAVLSGLAAYEGLDYTMPKQTKRCRFDDNCKKNEVCRDIDQYRNLDWDDKRVHYRACIKDAGGKTDKKVRGGRRGRCGVAAPHRGGADAGRRGWGWPAGSEAAPPRGIATHARCRFLGG